MRDFGPFIAENDLEGRAQAIAYNEYAKSAAGQTSQYGCLLLCFGVVALLGWRPQRRVNAVTDEYRWWQAARLAIQGRPGSRLKLSGPSMEWVEHPRKQ